MNEPDRTSAPGPGIPPDISSVAGYIEPGLYDTLYSWWTEDLDYYVGQARATRGPVLEVACGTGRVHLPLLAAGVDVDGFDLHPGFLEVLRRNAAERGLAPRLLQADMRDFTMPRRYDLIVIPFRAFLHNRSHDDELRTLRCCREHLEPGGRLVLDLFHPSFERLIEPEDPWRFERAFTDRADGTRLELWSRTRRDRVRQTQHSDMELRRLDADGRVTRVHPQAVDLRWIWRDEMELLLRVAGFARSAVAGGFDGRPLERDTDQMIWTALKD